MYVVPIKRLHTGKVLIKVISIYNKIRVERETLQISGLRGRKSSFI
jgi:hypothetical protein